MLSSTLLAKAKNMSGTAALIREGKHNGHLFVLQRAYKSPSMTSNNCRVNRTGHLVWYCEEESPAVEVIEQTVSRLSTWFANEYMYHGQMCVHLSAVNERLSSRTGTLSPSQATKTFYIQRVGICCAANSLILAPYVHVQLIYKLALRYSTVKIPIRIATVWLRFTQLTCMPAVYSSATQLEA